MWDLLEGTPLCDGHDPSFNDYTCRMHLAQLIGLLGPPPIELLQRGTETAHYFNPDGNNHLLQNHGTSSSELSRRHVQEPGNDSRGVYT